MITTCMNYTDVFYSIKLVTPIGYDFAFPLPSTPTPKRFSFSKYFCTRLATCLGVRRPPMACDILAHLPRLWVN